LYENRRYIRSVLNPPRLIQATLEEESPESIDVEVGNLQILPVELLQLVVDGSTIPLSEPIVLPGRPFDSLVELRRVRFGLEGAKLEEVDPEAEIDLEHRILGMQDVRREPVAPWNWLSQGISPNLARQEADFRDRPAIEVDDQRREIRFLPGRWVITRDVIVPEGFTLVAGPGTQLELDNASILSRSPVLLTGSVEDPVVLKTGESMTGSLVVLQTETVSLLENVVFDSLTSPLDPGLNITGAVTFYEAPVTVKRCYFRRARAEDALNLIRSRFEISESRFDQADSDALDIDFSDGLLIGTEFLSPTNDGVDISGSVVRMSDIRISGAGDKAVSVGEASRLLGGGLEISASQVAIASKDLSQVVLLTVTIDSAQIGLAAYQKKPEFGPASIEVESLGLKDVVDPYWVEIGSWVTVDGKTTAGTLSDPKPVFYPEG
jgi:hypothetical protein